MEFYKPFQRLPYYVYDQHANNVGIKSSVTVYLAAGESLASQNAVYTASTNSAVKQYNHSRNASQIAPYSYMDDSLIEIISKVGIQYDPMNEQAFKNALRATFASSYIITAIVNDKPGIPDTGGQVTNTISQSGDIVII